MPRTPFSKSLGLVLAACFLLLQTQARAEDTSWIFRLGASSTSIAGDLEDDSDAVDTNSGEGLIGTAEVKVHPRLGIEMGFMGSDQIGVRAGGALAPSNGTTRVLALADDLRYRAETAGLNVHLTPDRPVDLYVGLAVAYFHYSNLNLDVDLAFNFGNDTVVLEGFGVGTRVVVDDDFALGAVLGLDVSFGDSGWMLSAAVRAFESSAEVSTAAGFRSEVDIDPVVASVGVGFKF